jgi:superfamily II DNA or RNA helicase
MCELVEQFAGEGVDVVLYSNRRLLIEQLSGVLANHGIEFGVRAALYPDQRERPVQISSLPTERNRALQDRKPFDPRKWELHGIGKKGLVIVDEAHINATGAADTILARHVEAGHATVGFTATPINLGHVYDRLIVAGTQSGLRKCGALVPAFHYGPDEPDMRGFKQSVKTGEFILPNGKTHPIMTPQIFSRVLENWINLNPDRLPTILFGPGVRESIWFAEQFHSRGIPAAHIDGEGCWVDGQYSRGADRQQILADVRSGKILVLCNRFVLREGLDLPEVSHLILATVMGSLQTYLQSCGRGLRAAPGKDKCVIQDHGGHWWRHGSVNADRDWDLGKTETQIRGERQERLREKRDREPICCPRCYKIRPSGSVCPQCGHESQKRSRIVVQVDGTLNAMSGDIYKPRKVSMKSDTQRQWERGYYRGKNSNMTFNQVRGLFFRENGYWPPSDLSLMPVDNADWYRRVKDVPKWKLTSDVGKEALT